MCECGSERMRDREGERERDKDKSHEKDSESERILETASGETRSPCIRGQQLIHSNPRVSTTL